MSDPTGLRPDLKDHEIAKIVNDLRDIGKTYGQSQQLRERIARYIVPILKPEKETEVDHERRT